MGDELDLNKIFDRICATQDLRDAFNELVKQRDEAREIAFDCFNQACQVGYDDKLEKATYDHTCLSAYEHAQDALIEWGFIKESECLRR